MVAGYGSENFPLADTVAFGTTGVGCARTALFMNCIENLFQQICVPVITATRLAV